jgi:hypothetical protein
MYISDVTYQRISSYPVYHVLRFKLVVGWRVPKILHRGFRRREYHAELALVTVPSCTSVTIRVPRAMRDTHYLYYV